MIIGLARLVDWVLRLPEDLETEFDDKMTEYEEERKMEYMKIGCNDIHSRQQSPARVRTALCVSLGLELRCGRPQLD